MSDRVDYHQFNNLFVSPYFPTVLPGKEAPYATRNASSDLRKNEHQPIASLGYLSVNSYDSYVLNLQYGSDIGNFGYHMFQGFNTQDGIKSSETKAWLNYAHNIKIGHADLLLGLNLGMISQTYGVDQPFETTVGRWFMDFGIAADNLIDMKKAGSFNLGFAMYDISSPYSLNNLDFHPDTRNAYYLGWKSGDKIWDVTGVFKHGWYSEFMQGQLGGQGQWQLNKFLNISASLNAGYTYVNQFTDYWNLTAATNLTATIKTTKGTTDEIRTPNKLEVSYIYTSKGYNKNQVPLTISHISFQRGKGFYKLNIPAPSKSLADKGVDGVFINATDLSSGKVFRGGITFGSDFAKKGGSHYLEYPPGKYRVLVYYRKQGTGRLSTTPAVDKKIEMGFCYYSNSFKSASYKNIVTLPKKHLPQLKLFKKKYLKLVNDARNLLIAGTSRVCVKCKDTSDILMKELSYLRRTNVILNQIKEYNKLEKNKASFLKEYNKYKPFLYKNKFQVNNKYYAIQQKYTYSIGTANEKPYLKEYQAMTMIYNYGEINRFFNGKHPYDYMKFSKRESTRRKMKKLLSLEYKINNRQTILEKDIFIWTSKLNGLEYAHREIAKLYGEYYVFMKKALADKYRSENKGKSAREIDRIVSLKLKNINMDVKKNYAGSRYNTLGLIIYNFPLFDNDGLKNIEKKQVLTINGRDQIKLYRQGKYDYVKNKVKLPAGGNFSYIVSDKVTGYHIKYKPRVYPVVVDFGIGGHAGGVFYPEIDGSTTSRFNWGVRAFARVKF